MRVKARKTCRVCGNPNLSSILDLGSQCIAGAFKKPGEFQMAEPKLPLQLIRCDGGCGLVQLRHTVSSESLYSEYWYRSGVNRSMTEHLHEIAEEASYVVGGLGPRDLVIDIGCNDGTLLDGYETGHLVGVDPSDVTRYAVDKGYEVINDFFSAEQFVNQKATVITSIAMFYDLEIPSVFVADIARVLAPDGVWISEFAYLPSMLEHASFDTICHEHLEYYSLSVIQKLFSEAGLRIISAELNDTNGGSIRVTAGHEARHWLTGISAHKLIEREAKMGLNTPEPYEVFAQRVRAVRDELVALLRRLWAEGAKVHIYGASTKGNTILQYCGIDSSLIECAADRNPDKWGSETIGTHIPIVAEEASRSLRPDYYLVLPWHFLDEFVEREAEFLDRGGKFIVPLPEVRVIDRALQAA